LKETTYNKGESGIEEEAAFFFLCDRRKRRKWATFSQSCIACIMERRKSKLLLLGWIMQEKLLLFINC